MNLMRLYPELVFPRTERKGLLYEYPDSKEWHDNLVRGITINADIAHVLYSLHGEGEKLAPV